MVTVQKNTYPIEDKKVTDCQFESQRIQSELEACDFNLKTLNDISRDIYGSVETEAILKNFLLMCMGNFGVLNGFVLLTGSDEEKHYHFSSVGFPEEDVGLLRENCRKCLASDENPGQNTGKRTIRCAPVEPFGVKNIFPFQVQPGIQGLLGMGNRLMSDTYSNKERELLETLINSLVVALKNAKSFESILDLNRDLEEKNIALENALENLRAEM